MARIGIIGGGAWGTALSLVVKRAGGDAVLWAREPEVVAVINAQHENPVFLPGVRLDPAIEATGEIGRAADADAVLLTMPAQHLRKSTAALSSVLKPGTPAILCAKGIENGSCALMSEIAAEILPGSPIAALSGPTFAAEVAQGLPTAATLACKDHDLAMRIARMLASQRFRIYLSDDIIGSQIGGAVKNVLAIACGITMGRKLGENARAALITRGLAEMVRLGLAKGARLATLMGLSGFGDLSLTCNSAQSRNTSLGILLGQGVKLDDALARGGGVAEGAYSAQAVRQLAKRHEIDMPICLAVDRIINLGANIDNVIADLLDRPIREESDTSGPSVRHP